MYKKEEIKLIIFGIVASAYMVMAYDIIQEFAKTPIDFNSIITKVIAGIISIPIGAGIIWYLTWKRTTS